MNRQCFRFASIVLRYDNTVTGNEVHRAPEVLNAISSLLSSTATEVDIDLTGQAVFEAAMVIGTILLRRWPIRRYPERYQVLKPGVGMRVQYTLADVCVLTDAEAAGLRSAGVHFSVVDLIRAALHPDSSMRPSLSAFRDGLVRCLEPAVLSLRSEVVSLLRRCFSLSMYVVAFFDCSIVLHCSMMAGTVTSYR